MRGMRSALVCPKDASDVEVNYIIRCTNSESPPCNALLKVVAAAVDFLKFVKTTPGGEDLIHQFMGGQKQGQDKQL